MFIIIFNPRTDMLRRLINCRIIIIIFKNEGGKKIKKSTKGFEVEKLVRVVLRGKTVVQQYGVKTLNGNRNALK